MLAACRLTSGTHRLGPENATLSVRTKRAGAAAKAGHDLLIHVTAWEATIALADEPAETELELSADPTSLRVREGTGGIQALVDDDIENIQQTIDDEVLKRREIAFRSTAAARGPGGVLHVEGELTLSGNSRPDRLRPGARRRRGGRGERRWSSRASGA